MRNGCRLLELPTLERRNSDLKIEVQFIVCLDTYIPFIFQHPSTRNLITDVSSLLLFRSGHSRT